MKKMIHSIQSAFASGKPRPGAASRLVPILLGTLLTLVGANAQADTLDAALRVWIKTMDANHDRALSREELNRQRSRVASSKHAQATQSMDMLLRGFLFIDRNRDGELSAEEISESINTRFSNADRDRNRVLTQSEASAGMPIISRNFNVIDSNNNGTVDLQQVRRHMAQTMSHAAELSTNR
jgi:Ca2+-binding EF-hand superfamily protein